MYLFSRQIQTILGLLSGVTNLSIMPRSSNNDHSNGLLKCQYMPGSNYYKIDNPSINTHCISGQKFYCDKYGKLACKNRKMKDPPLCQKGITI
ncbi:hypothetical protein MXB_880 [Myxobolus squamalis]|nr:hypothetical protein MXB_880 [Myxobolus squamalis]